MIYHGNPHAVGFHGMGKGSLFLFLDRSGDHGVIRHLSQGELWVAYISLCVCDLV